MFLLQLPTYIYFYQNSVRYLKKLLHNDLTHYSLLIDCQFGFHPKYSTDLVIHHLCQGIYTAIHSKMYHVAVFCDFSKAFDTLCHTILLKKKLSAYGIRGVAWEWFKIYLDHRQQ